MVLLLSNLYIRIESYVAKVAEIVSSATGSFVMVCVNESKSRASVATESIILMQTYRRARAKKVTSCCCVGDRRLGSVWIMFSIQRYAHRGVLSE